MANARPVVHVEGQLQVLLRSTRLLVEIFGDGQEQRPVRDQPAVLRPVRYFETDEPDPPSAGADKGFRTYGHSKDHRRDLPQVVIGLAVTRDGIPIRGSTSPGNASDPELIRQVNSDPRA